MLPFLLIALVISIVYIYEKKYIVGLLLRSQLPCPEKEVKEWVMIDHIIFLEGFSFFK